MFYENLAVEGYDDSAYTDFIQPFISSFTKQVDDSTSALVFDLGDDIEFEQYRTAHKIKLVFFDGTALLTAPNEDIKIYFNLFDATEMDDTAVPFAFFLSPTLEFYNINTWLKSIHIKNDSDESFTVFIEISRMDSANNVYVNRAFYQ